MSKNNNLLLCFTTLIVILYVSKIESHNDVNVLDTLNWKEFESSLCGNIAFPNDDEYEAGNMGRYPSFDHILSYGVIYVECELDIVKSINYFRDNKIPFRIKSSGNSFAGYFKCNGCMILDLSRFKEITTHVYNNKSTQNQTQKQEIFFSVESGVIARDFVSFLQSPATNIYDMWFPHMDCPNIAFGGTIQGGGSNYIQKKYGFTSDYLIGVRIVFSNGSLFDVFESEYIKNKFLSAVVIDHKINGKNSKYKNRNLTDIVVNNNFLWAIRGGGGGNFGVALRFYFRTFPIIKNIEWVHLSYAIHKKQDIINHLKIFQKIIPDLPKNHLLLEFNPQAYWYYNNELYPKDWNVEYTFYFIDELTFDKGREYTLNLVNKLINKYNYIPTEIIIIKKNWLNMLIEDRFPTYDGGDGSFRTRFPIHFTSRFLSHNLNDDIFYDSIYDKVSDQLWNIVINNCTECGNLNAKNLQGIMPNFEWGTWGDQLDNNNERGSVSFRGKMHSWMIFIPIALNEESIPKLHYVTKIFNDDIMTEIGDHTFMAYIHSFNSSLKCYYQDDLLTKLIDIKASVDPINLFNFEMSIPVDDEDVCSN